VFLSPRTSAGAASICDCWGSSPAPHAPPAPLALAISVDADNPALRLYERLGYRELSRDRAGVRMLLDV
jgi:hypothetical protein